MVDASALLDSLARRDPFGGRVRERLEGERDQHAPQVLKAEALSGLRKLSATGEVTEEGAASITTKVRILQITTHPIEAFIPRMWALRHNLSVYDAWYIALAETLEAPLVTTDGRLARSPGIRCEVDLIS